MSPITSAFDVPATTDHPRYDEYEDSGVDWLGEIPAHWKTGPLKYFVSIDPQSLPEDTDSDFPLRYVDIGSVSSTGEIEEPEEYRFEDAPSRARKIVQDGDTIISTVRTYLKAIAYIENPPENLIVSTGFAVLRPGEDVDERFLGYLIRSKQFLDSAVSHSEGIGYPSISTTKLGRLAVWLPSLSEQQTIAAYLDRATERIDALIEKKKKLIDLLEEKRNSLISRVVTKGLDDNVEMQDSRLEWLGRFPAHWDTAKLKFLSESLQTGPFGSQLHSDEYITGGIPVINPSHLVEGRIEPEEGVTVDDKTKERISRHELDTGDLVFARRGDLGRCAMVTEDEEGWLCGTGSIRLRPNQERVVPAYLRWVCSIRGVAEWFDLKSVGSTMRNLNTDILGALTVSLPPLHEQRQIASYLQERTSKLGGLIDTIQSGVDQLSEYRTALISAAVTGQIDVREATGRPAGREIS